MPNPNGERPRRRSAGQREGGLGPPAASGRSPSNGMPGFAAWHEGESARETPCATRRDVRWKAPPVSGNGSPFAGRFGNGGLDRWTRGAGSPGQRGGKPVTKRKLRSQKPRLGVLERRTRRGALPNLRPALCSNLSARGAQTRKRLGPWLAAAPGGLTSSSGGGRTLGRL